jgi:hypothetical protein
MRNRFGRRSAGLVAILAAGLVFPAGAAANRASAPANGLGPLISAAATEDGGIGVGASSVAQVGLADDSVLMLLGLTPPGNPNQGPIPPPICGPGCIGSG